MELSDLLGQEVVNGDYIKHISVLQVVTDGNNIVLMNAKTNTPVTWFMYKCDSSDLCIRAINNSIKLSEEQIRLFKEINGL